MPFSEKITSMSSEPVNKMPTNAAGNPGDDDQHGVAKHVSVQHAPFRQSLGAGGEYDCLLISSRNEFLVSMVSVAKAADGQREQGQRQVPQVVRDLAEPAELLPILRGKAAQGEDVQVVAAGQQDDQRNRQNEAWNGVADEDHGAGDESKGVPSRTALATPSGIDTP